MIDSRLRWLLLAFTLFTPSLLAQEAEPEVSEGVARAVGTTGIVAYLLLSTVLLIAIGFAGRFMGSGGPSEFYQHSGKFGFLTVLIPSLIFVLAVVLGFIYAHVTYINPFVYVNVLLTLGYGIGMAVGLFMLLHIAKVRSNWMSGLMGVYTAATTVYCAWASFIYVLITKSEEDAGIGLMAVLGVPPFLWSMVQSLNETGWYEMFGGTPTGLVAWGLWALEAAIIGGLPLIAGFAAVREEVFSEVAGSWNEKQEGILYIREFEAHDANALVKKDFSVLAKYERGHETDDEVYRLDITTNEGDTSLCTCTLLLQTASYDDDGDRSEETENLFANLLLSAADLEALVNTVNSVPRPDPVYDISEDEAQEDEPQEDEPDSRPTLDL
jgi:hypothetical protein